MKNISQKKWISLSLDLEQKNDIDFLYHKFHNDIIGTHENDNSLTFYFDYKLKNIINTLNNNQLNINIIKYDNWHTKFEKYFNPIVIDKQISIVPSWFKIKKDNIEYIRIKPGMAFGTGTHETTQLIISQLKHYIHKEDNVLDLGSGSGILAIAAFKYGASSVVCYEYDKDCETNFFENMALNNISNNYQLLFDDVLSIQNFDYNCILANINKNVILDLLPNVKKFRSKSCKIILSGLLISDKEEVINLISTLKFNLIEIINKGEWICIVID